MDFLNGGSRGSLGNPSASIACGDASVPNSSEEMAERLHARLRDMQELICYLLRKNEELRMELFADGARDVEV